MAPHSSTLAWKIPWTKEPGRLQSMGPLRVRHDWVTSLSLFTFMHWRKGWQSTPMFLPGESQGPQSLVGCRLQGCTESGMTEATQQQTLIRGRNKLQLQRQKVSVKQDELSCKDLPCNIVLIVRKNVQYTENFVRDRWHASVLITITFQEKER